MKATSGSFMKKSKALGVSWASPPLSIGKNTEQKHKVHLLYTFLAIVMWDKLYTSNINVHEA
jgi:hypothetical protein